MSIKNVTGSFNSFADLAKAAGCKPVKLKKDSEDKTKAKQDKFLSKHLCRACHMPMTYNADTNVLACTNPDCKGIKITKIDKDGNEIVYYEPSYEILGDKGTQIANKLFA